MQNLNIALIQTNIFWESCYENLKSLDSHFLNIDDRIDLIILPEMFATGFSMDSKKISQKMNGEIVKWMIDKSKSKKAGVIGSVAIFDNSNFYNRLIFAMPDGSLFFYDKKHLFNFVGEKNSYCSGNKRVIVNYCGWNISLFICYDLRFPIWIRNFFNEYDIAIFVANWPESRFYAWNSLLVARAIENQSFVLGVNRVGTDGNNINYRGDSSIVSPDGSLIDSLVFEESIITSELIYNDLEEIRYNFQFWHDVDIDLIKYC